MSINIVPVKLLRSYLPGNNAKNRVLYTAALNFPEIFAFFLPHTLNPGN